ncbi:hypothetical protein PC114_g18713 [Phytophthora cactorum]|uniref:Uncharacterized protein n=1 Tax=Phytophthora cactorum TaxID=29920 RepID=A0A8T1ANW6_9STRA|nr:hypothetical protein PC115_g21484 [Phytophthora cactorum]KAG2887701.1 hypothetical protein PC114_g18713 [Phytophthora cactorum]KAG3145439.1 hypothetical protein C6341_g18390 [Phytophthora cactorum]
MVGNGSDEKPFIVGISTKAMMLRLMIPPEREVFRHLDATYKMDQSICDRQETQLVFQAALLAMR